MLLSGGVMLLSDGMILLSDGVMLLSGGPVKYLGNLFALAEGKVCLTVVIPSSQLPPL